MNDLLDRIVAEMARAEVPVVVAERVRSLAAEAMRCAANAEHRRCLDICTAVEPFPDGVTMRQTIRARIASGE